MLNNGWQFLMSYVWNVPFINSHPSVKQLLSGILRAPGVSSSPPTSMKHRLLITLLLPYGSDPFKMQIEIKTMDYLCQNRKQNWRCGPKPLYHKMRKLRPKEVQGFGPGRHLYGESLGKSQDSKCRSFFISQMGFILKSELEQIGC